jgi:hypothetical protein
MKLNALIALIVGIAFSSCEENNFHFNNPQPEDSKNLYSVPRKHRGIWHLDSKKAGISTITIGKHFYETIEEQMPKESKAELELDSKVFFVGGKMYYNEDGKLHGEIDYTLEGDSVIIGSTGKKYIEFGKNNFLRKFDYGYILNLKIEGMNNWYDLRFIDTRNKEGLIISEIGKEDLNGIDNYQVLHEDFSKYLIVDWTKQDFQNFIDNGGFSRELAFLKYQEKIKY